MNRSAALLRENRAIIAPNRVGRRRFPRLRLAIPAKLISRYDTRRCVLVDLSCTGARVSLEKPLAEGEDALLQIAGLEPFGTVVRCKAGKKGGTNALVFDPPLKEGEVLSVRSFSECYQEDEVRELRKEVRHWVTGT